MAVRCQWQSSDVTGFDPGSFSSHFCCLVARQRKHVKGERERERETETERETDTQTHRHTDTQTDRQTETEKERERVLHTDHL